MMGHIGTLVLVSHAALIIANLFFAGLLAGEEFIVFFGLRPVLGSFEKAANIRFRQALIRRLRVVVPLIFLPALVSSIVVLLKTSSTFRIAGLAAMLVFTIVTFAGTVPVNSRALNWSPEDPPANWKKQIVLWERLDMIRCLAAIAAFAFLLVALHR